MERSGAEDQKQRQDGGGDGNNDDDNSDKKGVAGRARLAGMVAWLAV